MATRKRDILSINDGEAGDVGAHMVIAFPDKSDVGAGLSRCAFEQMTGLSRSKVVSLIQAVADEFMEEKDRPTYQYEVKRGPKSGRGIRTDTTRLRVNAFTEKSESLSEDLEEGILEDIQFIKESSETDVLPQGLSRPKVILSVTVNKRRNYVRAGLQIRTQEKSKPGFSLDTIRKGLRKSFLSVAGAFKPSAQ